MRVAVTGRATTTMGRGRDELYGWAAKHLDAADGGDRLSRPGVVGSRAPPIVTEQAHYVDADSNVYQGFPGAGRLVGRTTPSQPGWAAWGSEAAGPPWDPPPPFRKPSKGQAARKGAYERAGWA